MNLPLARRENVTVRDLPDETLVYDHRSNKAHCLNPSAALVWRHCDGQTSLADLAARLQDALHIEQPEAVVQLALEQLSRRDLLEQPIRPLVGPARLARRTLLKQLAVAAALPVVMTMTAKAARAQGVSDLGTGSPSGGSCTIFCFYNAQGKVAPSPGGCLGGGTCIGTCPPTGKPNSTTTVSGVCS